MLLVSAREIHERQTVRTKIWRYIGNLSTRTLDGHTALSELLLFAERPKMGEICSIISQFEFEKIVPHLNRAESERDSREDLRELICESHTIQIYSHFISSVKKSRATIFISLGQLFQDRSYISGPKTKVR
jgi:hypothetical protein